ncbi:hypothetical protein AAE478_008997 [Parahypoxylon ruwenzoriense]
MGHHSESDFEKALGGALHSSWFSPINLDLTKPKVTQDDPRRGFTYGLLSLILFAIMLSSIRHGSQYFQKLKLKYA